MDDISQQIADTQAKISAVENNLSYIQILWDTEFDMWSEKDKDYYGTDQGQKDKKLLKKKEELLMNEKALLMKKEIFLMKKEEDLRQAWINQFQLQQERAVTVVPRSQSKKNILIQTKGADFIFSDRDRGMSKLIQCEFLRFLYFKNHASDRNCHPISFLADGPGSGKSRFLMEIQKYFSLHPDNYRDPLVSIAQARYFQTESFSVAASSVDEFVHTLADAVFVNITFGNGSPYARDEGTIRQSICYRILDQFIENAREYVEANQGPNLLVKTIKYIAGDKQCVVLGVDEVNKVNEVSSEDFKELFNILGGQSCLSEIFFIPVLAGTSIGSVQMAVSMSTHPPLHIPLPLLSFESTVEIMKARNVNVNDANLISILIDVGGHCRSLEILYDAIVSLSHSFHSDSYWADVRSIVQADLSRRYTTLEASTSFEKAVAYVVARIPVLDTTDLGDGIRILDLREAGLIKVDVSGLVLVPYIFASIRMKNSVTFSKFWVEIDKCKDFWWQDWEVFNCKYLTLRLACFSYLGMHTVTLSDFYKGANVIGCDASIIIPSLTTLEKSTVINYHFPASNQDGILVGQFVKNGAGAVFDGFGELEKDDHNIILHALQMKFYDDNTRAPKHITNELICDEFQKVNRAIYTHLRNLDFVLVILCRNDSRVDLSTLRCGKVVLVSQNELPSFYSHLFCQRFFDK